MTAMATGGPGRLDVSDNARPVAATSDDGGRRALYFGLGALIVAVLGAGSFFALSAGSHAPGLQRGEALPVIRADERPFKVPPDHPGGLEIPNRDKLVYGRLRGAAEAPEVERLLPDPERPLPPPETPAPVTATVAAAVEAPSTAAFPAAPAPETTASAPALSEAPVGQAPASPLAEAESQVSAALRPLPRPAAAALAPQVSAKAETKAVAAPPQAVVVPAKPATETKPEAKVAALPTTAPVGTRVQVQLGAMSSPELARAQWSKLLTTNADVLGRLQPSVVRADLGEKGVLYRLRAGPVESVERAQAVCKALSGRGVGCVVVSASG
jgi:hypothetical protein